MPRGGVSFRVTLQPSKKSLPLVLILPAILILIVTLTCLIVGVARSCFGILDFRTTLAIMTSPHWGFVLEGAYGGQMRGLEEEPAEMQVYVPRLRQAGQLLRVPSLPSFDEGTARLLLPAGRRKDVRPQFQEVHRGLGTTLIENGGLLLHGNDETDNKKHSRHQRGQFVNQVHAVRHEQREDGGQGNGRANHAARLEAGV